MGQTFEAMVPLRDIQVGITNGAMYAFSVGACNSINAGVSVTLSAHDLRAQIELAGTFVIEVRPVKVTPKSIYQVGNS